MGRKRGGQLGQSQKKSCVPANQNSPTTPLPVIPMFPELCHTLSPTNGLETNISNSNYVPSHTLSPILCAFGSHLLSTRRRMENLPSISLLSNVSSWRDNQHSCI